MIPTRYPELRRLALAVRAAARKSGIPEWAPGVILAFFHWWIGPPLLTYYLLVSEEYTEIASAMAICVLVGTAQLIYDSRCPLITVERHLLGCSTWWRGMPFSLIASYIQPTLVLGGTSVGLIRFTANTLMSPDE
jgi:hypothetical protein